MRDRIRAGIFAICALAGVGASAALAEEARRVVVLELFTSQGCSSCPPADEMVSELSGHPHVLPLALHVDYWDYIGWADSFARPEHTARQKAYARMAHQGSIYTPQIVIAGHRHVVGYKPMKVMDALTLSGNAPAAVSLAGALEGGELRVSVAPAVDGATPRAPLTVDLVSFKASETVQIRSGENAGKTITYKNIVTNWQGLSDWDGTAPLDISTTVSGEDALAVIVQEKGPGRILGAIQVR